MYKLLAVVTVSAATLGGCAFGKLDHGLSSLVGQDVHAAVAQLGAPSEVRKMGELREVAWETGGNRAAVVGVGGNGSDGFQMPRQPAFMPQALPGATTSLSMFPKAAPSPAAFRSAPQYCRVTVQVDSRDVIRDYRYDGNFDGCYGYGQLLGKS